MLIDYDTFDNIQSGFVFGFAGIAMLCAGLAIWKRSILIAAGAPVALVLCVVSIILPDSFAARAFIATHDGHAVQVQTARLIGTHTYNFANGETAELGQDQSLLDLVVNDTPKQLTLRGVTYSVGAGIPSARKPEAMIEPYTPFYTDLRIEYYGNAGHQPPNTVKEVGPVDVRYWLTWD